jgi:hypothetical protein
MKMLEARIFRIKDDPNAEGMDECGRRKLQDGSYFRVKDWWVSMSREERQAIINPLMKQMKATYCQVWIWWHPNEASCIDHFRLGELTVVPDANEERYQERQATELKVLRRDEHWVMAGHE